MAHTLSEQRFISYEGTKNWVDSLIASKDKELFRLGIRTLPERWKKVHLQESADNRIYQNVSNVKATNRCAPATLPDARHSGRGLSKEIETLSPAVTDNH
ncbi:Mariner Mos1 transposase [Eumeta japonica]|uniref:Mariner Mos1 transposase n=1 Tax=Eumeta variegata TaxID=151549 RepID=A0A4C1XMU3_EUMVA|nr:Mariner Mos1 transposase [Eumeta japonica]